MSEPEETTKDNKIVHLEDDKDGENKEDTGKKEARKQMAPRSEVWQHFTKNLNEMKILILGTCKYCNRSIKSNSKSNGTSAMSRHLTTCKYNPHKNSKDISQNTLQMTIDGPGISKFDPEELRDAFVQMVIEDEQPFSMGERSGLRKFIAKVCPRFTMPSRRTCTRGAVRKYFEEKAKLKQFFKKHGERVCLTTDCWTSKKQDGYMAVTANFIDDEWNLHKKIISFFKVKGHKGEDIGKNLQRVMNEWGMQKVMTVTVDNASSNDGGISYLRKQMVNAKTCIVDGRYLHMRYAAHIVNLIVSDGLKEVDLSVQRVRAAVRYIRNGTTRLDKFKAIVDEEKIDSDEENGQKVWTVVNKCLRELFEEYMRLYAPPSDATPEASNSQQNKDGTSVGGGLMKEQIAKRIKLNNGGSSRISSHKSELNKYLAEDCEDPDQKLDVLAWWKLNASRFPIVARLARDVLAIPISTVALESAFSTGGRILDDFRTSLTPFMLESLVCTQDWLRRTTPINVEENYEELVNLEKELVEEYGNGKGKGKATKKGKEKEKASQQATT